MPSPPRGRTRRTTIFFLSLATLTAVLLPAAPAHAAPTSTDVKAQITALNNEIETVVEQYNGITTKLDADHRKASKLQAALTLAQSQATDAHQRIARIAHDVYMAGPMSTVAALIEADSTTSLVDRMAALDVITRSQDKTVRDATSTAKRIHNDQAALNRIIADETAKKAALATKKATILAKIDDLTKLQAKLAAQEAAARAAAAAAAAAKARAAAAAATPKPTATSHGYAYSYVHPVACPQTATSGPGHIAAVKACSLVWPVHMYGWATAGPTTYDCSGLTMVAWKAAGKSLLHYTGDQWNETHAITRSQLRPGDLIFYNNRNHVAIYIGNGWIVQAEHTGEPLKESDMYFMTPVTNGLRRVNGT